MKLRFGKTALLGVAYVATSLVPSARAAEWDKKTIITLNESIQIEGTVLDPGQYVLKLVNSDADRRILQVYNADETAVKTTILGKTAYRLEPTGDTRFTFYEAPPGEPRALRTWFYPGDNAGIEFSAGR